MAPESASWPRPDLAGSVHLRPGGGDRGADPNWKPRILRAAPRRALARRRDA